MSDGAQGVGEGRVVPARVALFATCLVDLFWPEVGDATVAVLRRAGFTVDIPRDQTCCGQPLFNNGCFAEAARVARHTLRVLEGAEAVVVPSGSCATMLRKEYRHLFDDPAVRRRAEALGAKTYELSELLDLAGAAGRFGGAAGRVAYHASCHLLRGLGIAEAPRRLLQGVSGLDLVELPGADQCCGFGGSFSVKFPEISNAILEEKLRAIRESGAEIVVANDCGCLMHMAGGLERQGLTVRALHLAQVLAGGNHVR